MSFSVISGGDQNLAVLSKGYLLNKFLIVHTTKKLVIGAYDVSCIYHRRETIRRIKGLGNNSLAGAKLSIKPSRLSFKPKSIRAAGVVAKYGDKSVYFDLEDLGNTTGQWDLYGSDAPSPYNPLQSKFFETFAAPFTKRGFLIKFLILGRGSLLTYVSANSTGERGPREKPKLGPRGKL